MADFSDTDHPTDEEIIEGSSRRAKIISLVNGNPGREYTRQEIADGLGHPSSVADIGVLAKKLADQGVIGRRKEGLVNKFFSIDNVPNDRPAAEPGNFVPTPGGKKERKPYTRKAKEPEETEVLEIVVGGKVFAFSVHGGRVRVEIG